MKPFTLHIPKDIEAQLRRCRVSIRQSIRTQLKSIVERLATVSPASREKSPASEGPPHRFYVFEGYRISYQVDPITRRVVVLTLGETPA